MYKKSNNFPVTKVSNGINSKHPPDRGYGQRSIPSIFQSRSSKSISSGNMSGDENNHHRRVSLSDFLNKKLHKSSVLPISARDKSKASLSTVADENPRTLPIGEQSVFMKTREGVESSSVNLDLVLNQFKCNTKEKENENSSNSHTEMSRKRKSPFAGLEKSSRKHLVIIGDGGGDDTARNRNNHGQKEMVKSDNMPKHLFNHYANGKGWWDSDMAGVDSEEVGCNEAWEGLGSTTLGGLEWH
ncbi:uncharacterized protein LOC124940604 [Impatiens glandulifera]|uniref:uncharacterized protein LOC124940604 n=1 Tax=Impatiens glandulifera TaxID=253017 RepID=UPI001FB0ED25|nr:uncharacterized protein LOC124940604 [Impatiens glandulifera]